MFVLGWIKQVFWTWQLLSPSPAHLDFTAAHCLAYQKKKKAVANLTPVPNRLLPVINSPVIHKALTWTEDKEMSIVRWTDPTDSRGGSHQSKDSRVCVDQSMEEKRIRRCGWRLLRHPVIIGRGSRAPEPPLWTWPGTTIQHCVWFSKLRNSPVRLRVPLMSLLYKWENCKWRNRCFLPGHWPHDVHLGVQAVLRKAHILCFGSVCSCRVKWAHYVRTA